MTGGREKGRITKRTHFKPEQGCPGNAIFRGVARPLRGPDRGNEEVAAPGLDQVFLPVALI